GMAPREDLRAERSASGAHRDAIVVTEILQRLRLRRIGQVPAGPGCQHGAYVQGIALAEQEVVGVIQRDEALGVTCSLVDERRVLDPDDVVYRRVEDEEWPAERTDDLLDMSPVQVAH